MGAAAVFETAAETPPTVCHRQLLSLRIRAVQLLSRSSGSASYQALPEAIDTTCGVTRTQEIDHKAGHAHARRGVSGAARRECIDESEDATRRQSRRLERASDWRTCPPSSFCARVGVGRNETYKLLSPCCSIGQYVSSRKQACFGWGNIPSHRPSSPSRLDQSS